MLQPVDALDFWRLEAFENNKRLRLCAEKKLTDRAWLEFEVAGRDHGSVVYQTAAPIMKFHSAR